MDVNDNAFILDEPGVLETIASKLLQLIRFAADFVIDT